MEPQSLRFDFSNWTLRKWSLAQSNVLQDAGGAAANEIPDRLNRGERVLILYLPFTGDGAPKRLGLHPIAS